MRWVTTDCKCHRVRHPPVEVPLLPVAHRENDIRNEGVGLMKADDDPQEVGTEGVEGLLQGVVGHIHIHVPLRNGQVVLWAAHRYSVVT